MTTEICPYCGHSTIDGLCRKCRRDVSNCTSLDSSQALYTQLLEDLTEGEYAMNSHWKEFWHDRAEALRTLSPQLHKKLMHALHKYITEERDRNRTIMNDEKEARTLRKLITPTTSLSEMCTILTRIKEPER